MKDPKMGYCAILAEIQFVTVILEYELCITIYRHRI